jgi:2-keto-3-deoxy-L-fuconate dehydrogenase
MATIISLAEHHFAAADDDEVREQFEFQIPGGRIGDGQEAAELVLAIVTGASGFLAGQVIPISGGWVT